MRLLHTGDWHLGDRLGRIDRTIDIRRSVERIADCCRDEEVDILIVAGDIFSELARADALREAIEHLRSTFESFLRTGGTILAVTGNHDNETFCETLRHAMDLAAPHIAAADGIAAPGRLYLTSQPALLRLTDRHTGDVVQFVLMPYPTPAQFLTTEPLQNYSNLAEKNQNLRAAFMDQLAAQLADRQFDDNQPAVLVAHIGVTGADLAHRFRLSESEDLVVDAPDLAAKFTYVALGHVHKPQAIGGHEHVRYCGSVERLDLGESRDEKGIVIVDLPQRSIRTLPLNATPIERIEILETADIETLAGRYPQRANTLVDLHFSYTPGQDDLLEVQERLAKMFPRWYARDWTARGELAPALAIGEAASKSFEDSVRDYLTIELLNEPDDERDAIVSIAESMMRDLA
jgi:DNA repair protein SbcD/Mre11